MKRAFISLMLLSVLFSACKKENSTAETPPPEQVTDYLPLAVGNYWIYQQSVCDSGEVDCEPAYVDTTFVVKDTLIRGNVYYRLDGRFMLQQQTRYFRDSADYIVDHYGAVVFTHTDSVSIFNPEVIINSSGDTLFRWYYKLTENEGDVQVPSGSYYCLDMRGHFTRLIDDHDIDHKMHNLYSKDVGMVKQTTFYASSLKTIKRELIGYHIEPDGGVTP